MAINVKTSKSCYRQSVRFTQDDFNASTSGKIARGEFLVNQFCTILLQAFGVSLKTCDIFLLSDSHMLLIPIEKQY